MAELSEITKGIHHGVTSSAESSTAEQPIDAELRTGRAPICCPSSWRRRRSNMGCAPRSTEPQETKRAGRRETQGRAESSPSSCVLFRPFSATLRRTRQTSPTNDKSLNSWSQSLTPRFPFVRAVRRTIINSCMWRDSLGEEVSVRHACRRRWLAFVGSQWTQGQERWS